jgi:hypothetical protein
MTGRRKSPEEETPLMAEQPGVAETAAQARQSRLRRPWPSLIDSSPSAGPPKVEARQVTVLRIIHSLEER